MGIILGFQMTMHRLSFISIDDSSPISLFTCNFQPWSQLEGDLLAIGTVNATTGGIAVSWQGRGVLINVLLRIVRTSN